VSDVLATARLKARRSRVGKERKLDGEMSDGLEKERKLNYYRMFVGGEDFVGEAGRGRARRARPGCTVLSCSCSRESCTRL
jgi:hypothetical protein